MKPRKSPAADGIISAERVRRYAVLSRGGHRASGLKIPDAKAIMQKLSGVHRFVLIKSQQYYLYARGALASIYAGPKSNSARSALSSTRRSEMAHGGAES